MAYQRELWPVALVAITGPKPLHTDFSTERSIRTDARCQHAADKLIVISRPTPISARTFGSFHYSARREVRIHQRADIKRRIGAARRSEEHTSELQSLMRISYAVFCLKKKKTKTN